MFCWKYILLVLSVQYVCFAQTDYNAFSGEERDARRQLRRLDREYKTNTRKSLPRRGDCRTQDLAIRREWYVLLSSNVSSQLRRLTMLC